MNNFLRRKLRKGISFVAACAIMATNVSPWLVASYASEVPEEAYYEGADEDYEEASEEYFETPEVTMTPEAESADAYFEGSAEPTEAPSEAPDAADEAEYGLEETPDQEEAEVPDYEIDEMEDPDGDGIAEGVEAPDEMFEEDAFENDASEDDAETPDGQILENAPSVIFEESTEEVRVTVVAGLGVFPEGTTMEVKPAEDEETISKVSESVEDERTKVTGVKAVDVTFYNVEHEEIEPNGPVFVTLEDLTKLKENVAEEPAQKPEEAKAVHVTDEGECSMMAAASEEDLQYLPMEWEEDQAEDSIKKIEQLNEEATVAFIAESFSTYALVYTVDFEYVDEQTGNKIAWKWPGEGTYAIADIMAEIGVTGEIGDVLLVRTVDMGGSEKVLYLEEKDGVWYLTSEEAFHDTFELSVTVDERIYVLVITDAMSNPTTTGRIKITSSTPNIDAMSATLESDLTYNENEEKYTADFKVNFVIQPQNINTTNGYYIELDDVIIPDQFLNRDYSAQDPAKGRKSFTYRYIKQDNGKYVVLIDYDPAYVSSFGSGETIDDNFIHFTALIKKITKKNETEQAVKVTDDLEVIIPDDKIQYPENEDKNHQIKADKNYSGYTIDADNKIHVQYTTRISSTKGTDGAVTVNDVLTYNMNGNSGYTYEEGYPKVSSVSITSFKRNGSSMSVPAVTSDLSVDGKIGMSYEVPWMSAGDYYDVTYEYVYDKPFLKDFNVSEFSVSYSGSNTLKLETGDLEHEDSASYQITKNSDAININKSGAFDAGNSVINWTIWVSFNDDVSHGVHKVVDNAFVSTDFVSDSIHVYDQAGNEVTSGWSLSGDTITLPTGTGEYYIKYQTRAERQSYTATVISNTATGYNGDKGKENVSNVTVPAESIIEKSLVRDNISFITGTDGNGAYRDYTFTWHVSIPVPEGGFPAGTKITDNLKAYVWSVNNNRNENHTFTEEQKTAFMNHWKAYFGDSFNMSWTDGSRYEITLNEAWTNPGGIETIAFDYSSTGRLYMDNVTVKLGSDSSGDSFSNTLTIDGVTSNEPKWEYQQFLQKKPHGSTKTEIHRSDSDRTITWDIILVLDANYNNLRVVDTLPAGLNLKNISVGSQYACWDLFKSEQGSTHYEYKQNGDWYNGLDEIENWNQGWNVYRTEENTTSWGHSLTDGIVVTADQAGQAVTVNIDQVGSYRPVIFREGSTLYVRITAQVDEDQFDSYDDLNKSYTNTASVFTGSIPLGEDSSTQTTKLVSDTISKGEAHGSFNDNSDEGGNHRLNYTIDINKDGHSLLEDADGTLQLEDVLTYQKADDFDFTVMLVPDSVKLYKKVGSDWVEYNNPAEPWVYTFAESTDPSDSTIKLKKLFVKGIPDDTILQLRYSYEVQVTEPQAGVKYSIPAIHNYATLIGTKRVSDGTETTETWEEFTTQAGTISSGSLKIVKVDSENYSAKLAGAKFKLEHYTDSGWVQIDAIGSAEYITALSGKNVYVTNNEGIINIAQPGSATKFSHDVAYRIVEVDAPVGYSIIDPTPTAYFFFSENKKANELNYVPTDSGWSRADNLLKESDNLWVGNTKTPELIITKSVKGEKNFDEVRDTVSFRITGPNNFDETVQLNSNGWTWDDENQIYVYRIKDGIKNNTTYQVEEINQAITGVVHKTTYSVNSRAVQQGDTANVLVRYGSGKVDYTNIYGETEIVAQKIWNDQNNAESTRPASIELRLLKNGVDMGDSYAKTLNEAGNWKTEWTGLDAAETYEVAEVAVDGYVSAVVYTQNGSTVSALTGDGSVTITNRLTNVYVKKEWDPTTPASESIGVKLYGRAKGSSGSFAEITVDRFGNTISSALTLTAPSWSGKWENLSVDYDYKVVETSTFTTHDTFYKVNGGEEVKVAPENVQAGDTVTVVNRELQGIKVKKIWIGDNPPASIDVELWRTGFSIPAYDWQDANGGPQKYKATLTAPDWEHEWTGLSSDYTYQVKEISVSGYTTTYSDNNATGLQLGDTVTITNTKQTTGIAVQKVWDVDDDNDIKPVTVVLKKGTISKGDDTYKVTIYHENRYWSSGIQWKKELYIKPGTSIVINGLSDYDKCEETSASNCTFMDVAGAPVITPTATNASITVKANSNTIDNVVFNYQPVATKTENDVTIDTVTLDATSNWYKEWSTTTDPALIAGECYYIVETKVGDDPIEATTYVPTYTNNDGIETGLITITNTKTTPQTGSVKVTKAFSGIDSLPDSFKITASWREDGVGKTKDLTLSTEGMTGAGTASNPYTWTIDNLPLGTLVTFTESGATVDGATLTITANGTAVAEGSITATATSAKVEVDGEYPTATFVNEYKQTTDFEFSKIWKDIGNQPTEWPTGATITVRLNAYTDSATQTGVLQDQTLTFSPKSLPEGWSVVTSTDGKKTTFKANGLPAVTAAGDTLTYYVVETQVSGYKAPSYATSEGKDLVFTGSDVPKATNGQQIINTPEGGYELPSTGGPGTRLFTILGSILILGAGVLLWRRRRTI